MRVDIGNALDGELGLTREALETLDERVADAHGRIVRGRDDREHGYAALALPEVCDPDEIRQAVGRFTDVETVLTVGIGGSALGAATIAATLGSDVDAVFLDNVDPAWVSETLADLDFAKTVVNVVSRSGTTAETLANFLVVREAYDRADVDWTDRTLVTTGSDGPLRELAHRQDLPVLDVPDGVPGRFSALSTVGLAVAAFQGHDLEALLSGAAAAADQLGSSLFESPAYAYGATTYALAERGAAVNVIIPYAERLERFGEWFAQLWAESLGKEKNGQTPARALGATDQHSQLQLYRAGAPDKMVTLVRPREVADRPLPESVPEGVAFLEGASLGELLDAEFRATEASLAAADRENLRIEIDRLDEHGLGELLFTMEAACILYGELAGLDTFTQPAVEWGKRAARGLLGDAETPEAKTVQGKRRLEIE